MQMIWSPCQDYAIYHGEPVCREGERMYPAYHHEEYSGQTENLELQTNGTFVVSWDDRWGGAINYVELRWVSNKISK